MAEETGFVQLGNKNGNARVNVEAAESLQDESARSQRLIQELSGITKSILQIHKELTAAMFDSRKATAAQTSIEISKATEITEDELAPQDVKLDRNQFFCLINMKKLTEITKSILQVHKDLTASLAAFRRFGCCPGNKKVVAYVAKEQTEDASKKVAFLQHLKKELPIVMESFKEVTKEVNINAKSDNEIDETLLGKQAEVFSVLTNKTESPILILNMECFSKIFSYLDINSQVGLAKTCERVEIAFQCYAQDKYNHLKEETLLELAEKTNFLELVGNNVISYDGRNISPIFLKLCPNLQQLKMDFAHFNIELLKNLQKLQDWDILSSKESKDLVPVLHKALQRLPLLRKLKVSYKDNESLQLGHLPQLRWLEIENDLIAVPYLCSEMPNLRHLNISKVQPLHDNKIKFISENFPHLERLGYNGQAVECIVNLDKLQHLLIRCDKLDITFLRLLTTNLGSQLQSLILPNVSAKPEHWQYIVRLSNLRELKLRCLYEFSLDYLGKMRRLECLHVDFCNFSAEQWSELFLICPKLHTLHLDTFYKETDLLSLRDGLADFRAGRLRLITYRTSSDSFLSAFNPHIELIQQMRYYAKEFMPLQLGESAPLLFNEEL